MTTVVAEDPNWNSGEIGNDKHHNCGDDKENRARDEDPTQPLACPTISYHSKSM
jgi:hypothetical protein